MKGPTDVKYSIKKNPLASIGPNAIVLVAPLRLCVFALKQVCETKNVHAHRR
jgi:hypothetical protein